jgi:hypothetical protein
MTLGIILAALIIIIALDLLDNKNLKKKVRENDKWVRSQIQVLSDKIVSSNKMSQAFITDNVQSWTETWERLNRSFCDTYNYLREAGIIYGAPTFDKRLNYWKEQVKQVVAAEDLAKLHQELASAVKEMQEISNNSSECLAVEIGQIREKHAKLAQYLNVAFIPAAIEAKEGYYRKSEPTQQKTDAEILKLSDTELAKGLAYLYQYWMNEGKNEK